MEMILRTGFSVTSSSALENSIYLMDLLSSIPTPGLNQQVFTALGVITRFIICPQALTELAESVYAYLGLLDINLGPWKVYYDAPTPLMRQMNGWACGFFTIHAMQVIANGGSIAAVTNEHTERIQTETSEMILNNLP
jgi:hypothetical protein